MGKDHIKHFSPIELPNHFEFRSSQIKMCEHGEYLEVEFEQKNELPQGYAREYYESRAFLVRGLQHFPIRSASSVSSPTEALMPTRSLSMSDQAL